MISTLSDFREKRLLKMSFLSIYAFLQIVLMLIIIVASSRADANRHQTNKNDISNLFQSEIEDRQGWINSLKTQRVNRSKE